MQFQKTSRGTGNGGRLRNPPPPAVPQARLDALTRTDNPEPRSYVHWWARAADNPERYPSEWLLYRVQVELPPILERLRSELYGTLTGQNGLTDAEWTERWQKLRRLEGQSRAFQEVLANRAKLKMLEKGAPPPQKSWRRGGNTSTSGSASTTSAAEMDHDPFADC